MRSSFLILFLLIAAHTAYAHAFDSLRVEKKNGKKFIVHRVEPKETLYGISKKYNVSIDDIQKFNEGTDVGLKMYQELLIPFKKKKKSKKQKAVVQEPKYHVVQTGETLFALSRKYNLPVDSLVAFNGLDQFNIGIGDTIYLEKRIQRPQFDNQKSSLSIADTDSIVIDSSKQVHTVVTGETLYSISKKYNVSVDSLISWNELKSNTLEIEQKLYVSIPVPETIETLTDSLTANSDSLSIKEVPLDTIFVETNNKPFQAKQEMTEDGLLMTNEGMAMKIDQSVATKKYLALHRSAPVGTVIEIKNQMNGVTINARVVGKLPDTGLNRNVLIRVSGAAFKKLGAIDARVPVQTSYIRPQ